MKKKVAMELGMGSSLRHANYTAAAMRAVEDALWRNALTVADALGFTRDEMIIDVEIAVQKPDEVNLQEVASVFPYGKVTVTASKGGLDIAKPAQAAQLESSDVTVMAQAAIIVSFDFPEEGAA